MFYFLNNEFQGALVGINCSNLGVKFMFVFLFHYFQLFEHKSYSFICTISIDFTQDRFLKSIQYLYCILWEPEEIVLSLKTNDDNFFVMGCNKYFPVIYCVNFFSSGPSVKMYPMIQLFPTDVGTMFVSTAG